MKSGFNTLVLVLIGGVNLSAVFQLLARQAGDNSELKASTTALRQATDALSKANHAAVAAADAAVKSSDSVNAAAAAVAPQTDCESVLDKLDTKFNSRRKARRQTSFTPNLTLAHKQNNAERTFWDKYEPEAVCFDEERFGGSIRYDALGDGPKFVCGADYIAKKAKKNEAGCLVYSIGSNNDISFEKAVKSTMGCEIHTFDPTVATDKFVGHDITTFHEWGLDQDNSPGTNYKSVATVIKELGHEGRTIDIFKIDCEGCEAIAMPPLLERIAKGEVAVNQIQIEMHQKAFVGDANALDSFFDKVDNANFRIFHKERNQWGCMGYKCLEYSFVNEKFLREVNGEYVCHRV